MHSVSNGQGPSTLHENDVKNNSYLWRNSYQIKLEQVSMQAKYAKRIFLHVKFYTLKIMWWCYKKSIKISFFFFFCLILQWQTTNNRGLNRILISQSALCCGCWCHLPFLICYSILHFVNPDLLELTKVREKSAPCPVNSQFLQENKMALLNAG